jgi:hypothetical protein
MITNSDTEKVRGWFTGRLPADWTAAAAPDVTVDREEVTVVLTLPDVELADAGDAERAEARAGRTKAFREETRDTRIGIAREAEHRFGRKISWAVRLGDRTELFTHVSAPTMTRLRQRERLTLDTLVDAGVARSRAEALAWCVRLVGRHEDDWLAELREAMTHVEDVRSRGPQA